MLVYSVQCTVLAGGCWAGGGCFDGAAAALAPLPLVSRTCDPDITIICWLRPHTLLITSRLQNPPLSETLPLSSSPWPSHRPGRMLTASSSWISTRWSLSSWKCNLKIEIFNNVVLWIRYERSSNSHITCILHFFSLCVFLLYCQKHFSFVMFLSKG